MPLQCSGAHRQLIRRILLVLALARLLCPALPAQALRIIDVVLDAQGKAEVQHTSDTGSYYVLYRGAVVTAIDTPVHMALGGGPTGRLHDSTPVAARPQVFYRVRSIPLSQPLDLDGDGIDDVYELRHAEFLDPLNTGDGAADFDGDGVSNADEYRANTDPTVSDALTRVVSSPAGGEQGVSVNREVILHFSRPLAANTLIGPAQFHADFGGRTLLGRIELAPDRQTAWLFHQEPLPASARVRVTFNGDAVMDSRGKAVDADGDGQPGGMATIEYDTASATIVDGTAVIAGSLLRRC